MNCCRVRALSLSVLCFLGVLAQGVLAADVSPEAIVVNGDEVEYFPDERKVVGKGNISIDYRGSVVKADAVTVFLDTKDAVAEGEVLLIRGEDEFRGKGLYYNFDRKEGTLVDARGKALPWYFGGKEVERKNENTFLVKEGYVTTCDLPNPHYVIRTKEIELRSDERFVARNVTFQTKGIPVFYAPIYSRSLQKGKVDYGGVSLIPGYSSRWGAYALSSWAMPLADGVSTRIHLDERTQRGFGTGADFLYESPFGEGELKTYYINDEERQSPIDVREDRDRYRGRWLHRWDLSPTTVFLGEYQKWSDRFMTRDYFNGEYMEDYRPDTRGTLVHDAEKLTAALTFQKRANHFFTQTERLPELQVTSQELPLWDTGLYYLGEANVGNLTRSLEGGNTTTTERVDLLNQLSYPTHFSGIQAVPQFSVRQTYYGKETAGEEDAVRALMTAGLDLSTRFRRLYPVEGSFWGVELSGLRHIIEPGLKYRYTPEPTLLSSRLPDFDEIDRLTEANRLTFVLDNKFQTRRTFGDGEKAVVDFVDFVLTSNYDFKSGGEGKLVDVGETLEFRPSPFWGAVLESTYGIEQRDFTETNLDFFVFEKESWRLDLLHRYEKGVSNQLTTKCSFQVHPLWKIELYERYEIDKGQFEEEEIVLTRDLHCMEGALGFNVRDTEDLERPESEFSVYVAFRLKAFPEGPLEFGNRASISRRLIGERRSGETE
ncbi:MAG: LPS assembly protein LptD [Candidatus Omnitrophota bacterium]